MKNGADIEVESTPVIDLNRHGLIDAANSSDDIEEGSLPGEWDNEKTEVYTDAEEDGNAFLIDADGEPSPITAFPFVMGRGTECDMVLTGKGVSRKHAEVVFQSGRFVVNDLNSLNGIKVNGYKVSRVILEEGDVIKLGDVTLTFSQGGTPAPAKPKKASLFNKPKETPAADETFGPSPAKKFTKVAVIGVSFCVIGAVAWVGLQQFSDSQRAEQQLIGAAAPAQATNQNAQRQAAQQQPEQRNQNTSAAQTAAAPAAATATAPKPAVGAPPPSIAMAPIAPQNKLPESRPSKPEKVSAPEPEPVKPVEKKAPTINRTQQAAAKLLASAESEFLSGNAPQLFTNMTKYENNSQVYASTKAQLKNKHEELARLYGLYERGQKAFVSGDKQGAFVAWSSFLEKEARIFGKAKSVYADQVTSRVVEEYVSRGNEASKAGKHHEAYELWQKALSIGESVAAKIAIDNANTKSRQLYRQALRLEYVNSSKAKELWNEVVNLVPPGTEYHTKASSKLAWYERWGA
ncbi:MAG: FHA domain-containing protein [Ketobacteraceae bacterium]|nr:FHA domain-containing protein [Ketobacteraceae bacterium]